LVEGLRDSSRSATFKGKALFVTILLIIKAESAASGPAAVASWGNAQAVTDKFKIRSALLPGAPAGQGRVNLCVGPVEPESRVTAP
jgi:hypothetical protein